jgi:hypothetical protein
MREAVHASLAEHEPTGLVVDFRGFEYRSGDWIGSVPLGALRTLGRDRVCVLAASETAAALRSLWELGKLDQLIPLVEELDEAIVYLSGSGEAVWWLCWPSGYPNA